MFIQKVWFVSRTTVDFRGEPWLWLLSEIVVTRVTRVLVPLMFFKEQYHRLSGPSFRITTRGALNTSVLWIFARIYSYTRKVMEIYALKPPSFFALAWGKREIWPNLRLEVPRKMRYHPTMANQARIKASNEKISWMKVHRMRVGNPG